MAAEASVGANAPVMSEAELRAQRRALVFEAMERADVDVVVLSRRDSLAYATGARGLWTAGTRPFGAAGVLVTADRSVHLLSTWDAGIPDEIPVRHLYGVTWNPAVMGQALRGIPGFREARRLGVDGLSVGFERAVGRLAPQAELVPVDDVLHAVRAVKLPAEVERIRAAVAVADAAVEAATAALHRGSPPSDALGAALQAAATRGVTIPSSAPLVEVDPPGSLARLDLGFLVDGYEAGRGRTVVLGDHDRAVVRQISAAHERLVGACRPGASADDLRAVVAETPRWRVRGAGMGFELPIVTASLGVGTTLVEGMVLSVEVSTDSTHHRDLIHVGAVSPEVL